MSDQKSLKVTENNTLSTQRTMTIKEGLIKIQGFESQKVKENLINDLSEQNFYFVKNGPDLIKEVKDDEIVLSPEITEDTLEKILKFMKESEKY